MSVDWDDLRFFQEVARTGSLAGAARGLGVNHSTVYRRIRSLEDKQQVRLFERKDNVYSLTAAGAEMQASSERIAEEIDTLNRRLSGQDLRLSGPVRITTTDSLSYRFLAPHFAAFKAAYPGIDLEIVLDHQQLNLTRRQADIAIRPTTSPPETLVGRRVGGLVAGIYGSREYFALHGETDDLSAHTWLALDDSLGHLTVAKWMTKTLDNPTIALRANNFFALFGGAVNGMGLAPLPCFLADVEPALVRILTVDPKDNSGLWLLTHEDLRRTARIRAFMDFFYDALGTEIDLMEGRRPYQPQ